MKAEEAPPHHKRRSVPHNKHTAYPGMWISRDMTIVNGSIKGKTLTKSAEPPAIKGTLGNDPLWSAYFAAAKKCGSYGSSSPLQMRRMAEDTYTNAYKRLLKAGQVQKIKNKYTSR